MLDKLRKPNSLRPLLLALFGAIMVTATPAWAQIEASGARELRDAMRRIAQQPTDADALTDAGNAALLLGDPNAALNFFTRANTVQPSSGRIKSGLASALVRTENPFEALRQFDEAVRLGISERTIAADRAMAFDLLGNFERAQQDYQLARTAASPNELVIRQAVSLSLMGRKNDADAMLLPLLQKDDPSAWRARAFMLAARGESKESMKVAQGFLSESAADRMQRYLRQMPELTGAQQAAAIHLGHFPANNIGRDSEQVRRVASTIPQSAPASGGSRLIPSGDPFGPRKGAGTPVKESRQAKREREKAERTTALAAKAPPAAPIKNSKAELASEIARSRIAEAASASSKLTEMRELPPPDTARPLVKIVMPETKPLPQENIVKITEAPPAVTPASPGFASLSKPTEKTAEDLVLNQPVQGPTVDGATLSSLPATPVSVPFENKPVPIEKPEVVFDLGTIVGSIEIPKSEQERSVVAVDLKKIAAAASRVEEKTKVETKKTEIAKAAPKEPAYPARYWVQIATGQTSALGYDLRSWNRKEPELFKGKEGWTSLWGKMGRLLIGPFDDQKDAKKFEADFRKNGGDGFVWKSDDGTVVEKLKSK